MLHQSFMRTPSRRNTRPVLTKGYELIALVQDESAARELAELYHITLVSYSNAVAVYTTNENPFNVVAAGQKMGYPPLSLNYMQKM